MARTNIRSARAALVALAALCLAPGVEAQQPEPAAIPESGPIDLSLERMVDLALSTSYRVRHLNLDIDRTRLYLKASRARLRSRVDLDFTVPAISHVSETRWNSDLQRNVIQRENSRRVAADLSIRQPVILFGYPTNGYLSLNSRMYRLTQSGDDGDDIRYYNRYFVSYTQPLFQANELKNDLEEAELDLESQELEFYSDIVDIIDNSADDYYELFEIAYRQRIREAHVERLEDALTRASSLATADSSRTIDVDRIQVELANAREQVTSSQSRFRLETSSLKTEFGIPQEREIVLEPVIRLARVPIDEERAAQFAMELTPQIRQLDISRREAEIRLDNAKGRGGFELDVSLSYGREMQDEVLGRIWDQPENSYTVDVEGSLPIWDWGERDARIQAQQIDLQQRDLFIEERTLDIRTGVQNEVRNVAEYEDRAFNMENNLELARGVAERSLAQYEEGQISALDMLQSFSREVDTAENFLDAYLGWREALQRIQEMTFYDFERDDLLLDRFGISFEEGVGPDR